MTAAEAWARVQRGEARLLDLRTEAERRRYGWPPGAPRVSLAKHVAPKFEGPAAHFDPISNGLKTFIMKPARAVAGKKAVDFAPLFGELAGSWSQGMSSVGELLRY